MPSWQHYDVCNGFESGSSLRYPGFCHDSNGRRGWLGSTSEAPAGRFNNDDSNCAASNDGIDNPGPGPVTVFAPHYSTQTTTSSKANSGHLLKSSPCAQATQRTFSETAEAPGCLCSQLSSTSNIPPWDRRRFPPRATGPSARRLPEHDMACHSEKIVPDMSQPFPRVWSPTVTVGDCELYHLFHSA